MFIGFFLAALLGIIGISNLINTIASDVFSRKIELASMQSIGMTKKQLWAMLLFLAALLGIIGISNLINTIASDVFSRKIELASMQSIGMTKKQLWAMLLIDTVKFTSVAVLLMLIVGGVLSYLITQSSLFTGFNVGIFLLSAGLLILLVAVICVLMTWSLVKVLNQKSIVERLREIE